MFPEEGLPALWEMMTVVTVPQIEFEVRRSDLYFVWNSSVYSHGMVFIQ